MSATASGPDGLSAWLRHQGDQTWRQAVSHPMVAQIGAGTLPYDIFHYYFTQNIRYLQAYARAIAAVMAKTPDGQALAILRRFLGQIVDAELPANRDFLQRLSTVLGRTGASPDTTEQHLVTEGYTRHLLHTSATDTCMAGLTAILPCQWSYGELAKPLRASPPEDPIYADWIALFGAEDYDDQVGETTGLLDRLASDAGPSERDRLLAIFELSTRWEIAFWDMAFKATPRGDPAKGEGRADR